MRAAAQRSARPAPISAAARAGGARGRSVRRVGPRSSLEEARSALQEARSALEEVAVVAAAAEPMPLEFPSAAGTPSPLGPSVAAEGGGVNFAVFSSRASAVWLVLQLDGLDLPIREVALARSGDVWHARVDGLPLSGVRYGYRVRGEGGWEDGDRWEPGMVLLDPYAPLVDGRRRFGEHGSAPQWCAALEGDGKFLGTFDFASAPFDWGAAEASREAIPLKDSVIYEMNVRAFTADESSGVEQSKRGSFLGVAERVDHLKELGVTAVELLPVHEFDELEFQRFPNPRDHMVNTWGYSTVNFFAPMCRYASAGGGPVAAAREFKQMVRTLHENGIEVILDVVYNHTNEGGDHRSYNTCFRGLDAKAFYMMNLGQSEQLLNYSGCGNTLNCNHPAVLQMIVDSLRHWVEEYHVDGFRFDLASIMCRGEGGTPLSDPLLVRAITKDPVLSQVKLIAEPWDAAGLYQVGSFPNWDVWAEWNGRYRDSVRNFIKGSGNKSAFASALAGSADLYHYNNRRPFHSINFVTAHDGFTMMDLVSYNSKRNHDNGEDNNDGSNDNLSWNCGEEGETGNGDVLARRQRQCRNFALALMLSQGVPMMVMGDEYGHTRYGNNNSYGHDNHLNNVQWAQMGGEAHQALTRFWSELIAFRRRHPSLGVEHFLGDHDITWHEDRWDDESSSFLAFTLRGKDGAGDLFVAFNGHEYGIPAPLHPPPPGQEWHRVVDSSLPAPRDILPEGRRGPFDGYEVPAYSAVLFEAKP